MRRSLRKNGTICIPWVNGYSKQIRITLNVILVLGSIGLDETLKNPRVLKYNDDTLKYARLSIQKLEAGKTSSKFGFGKFTYAVLTNPKGSEDGDNVNK